MSCRVVRGALGVLLGTAILGAASCGDDKPAASEGPSTGHAAGSGGRGGGGTGGPSGAAGMTASTGGESGSAPGVGGRAGGAGGADANAGGAAVLGGAPGCGTAGVLTTVTGTATKLVDLFVGPEGIIVVQSDGVALYGHDRQFRRSVPFAREIVSAAVDGNLLVIADRAALTAMSTDLTMGPSVFVRETCVASVLVSGGQLICGPANDWDRIFYTYDMTAAAPALVAMSAKYTYNGIPMRRVPGTDDFVTVSDSLSPSDFHLYRVGATGAAVFVNESPYHGDFEASRIYAFDGSPAQHLIQTAGLLLKVYGDGCTTVTNSFTSGCFVKDGVLGTLQTSQYFIGLSDDGAGTVYGVVSPSNSFFDAPCMNGCSVQRINVATRTIQAQKTHSFPSVRPGAMQTTPDTMCARLVVGYGTLSPTSSLDAGGFQVQTFDL